LASARSVPAGWQRGVVFLANSCLGPQPWPYCPPELQDPKTFSSPGSVAEFEPFGIVVGIECTALSRESAGEHSGEVLDVVRDYQVGVELATGATSTNPSLADATPVVAGAAGIVEALATVEQQIASTVYGRLGFVHVAPADLTRLLAAQAIWKDGVRWRTATGNVVVSSPGYHTLAGTLYATGEVYAATADREFRTDLNRADNTIHALAEEIGIAVFDPCFNISVAVT
jgi:hypothetical protein